MIFKTNNSYKLSLFSYTMSQGLDDMYRNRAEHYGYLASQVAQKLEEIAQKKSIEGGEIKPGVRADLGQFFSEVEEGLKNPNLPLSTRDGSTYVMAEHWVVDRRTAKVTLDRETAKTTLRKYDEFSKTLPRPRTLAPDEIALATEMGAFFRRIERQGNSESYARRMGKEYSDDYLR